jgi:hypothetical protein
VRGDDDDGDGDGGEGGGGGGVSPELPVERRRAVGAAACRAGTPAASGPALIENVALPMKGMRQG